MIINQLNLRLPCKFSLCKASSVVYRVALYVLRRIEGDVSETNTKVYGEDHPFSTQALN